MQYRSMFGIGAVYNTVWVLYGLVTHGVLLLVAQSLLAVSAMDDSL